MTSKLFPALVASSLIVLANAPARADAWLLRNGNIIVESGSGMIMKRLVSKPGEEPNWNGFNMNSEQLDEAKALIDSGEAQQFSGDSQAKEAWIANSGYAAPEPGPYPNGEGPDSEQSPLLTPDDGSDDSNCNGRVCQ